MTTLLQDTNVLLLDDDLSSLEELAEFLESRLYRVWTASSVEAAAEIMRSETVDVFLVDMELPGMSGFEFMRWQGGEDALRRTIIMSGHYGKLEAILEDEDNSLMVLKKPLSLHLLLDAIAGMVAGGVEKADLRQTFQLR